MVEENRQTKYRVLVVEDEALIADELACCLADAGAEVVGPFYEIDTAMQHLDAGPIHFAILDVDLKGEPSFELAEALLERKIPFVFATGHIGEEMPMALQAVQRWQKPFNVAGLARLAMREASN